MVAVAVREDVAGYTAGNQTGSELPSEAVLARLWAGQRFPVEALVTIAGARVEVLHPGLRGRGAGPDFRHAALGAGTEPLVGGEKTRRRGIGRESRGSHRNSNNKIRDKAHSNSPQTCSLNGLAAVGAILDEGS